MPAAASRDAKNSRFLTNGNSNKRALTRATLGASERIKLKKEFDGLFEHGSSFFLPPLRVIYQLTEAKRQETVEPELPARAAFSAPKRIFKTAVERNRIKRRMRESYRQLKPALYQTLLAQNKSLLLLFVCQQRVEKNAVAGLPDVISKAMERLTTEIVKPHA